MGQLAAAVPARPARCRALLGFGEDRGQVVAADVERFAVAVQRRVQVFAGKARLCLGRADSGLSVRVAMPRQPVPGHCAQHHQHRVQAHRRQREPEAGIVHRGPSQHGGDGHRTTGRMQTAQRGHRRDRQPARQRRRQQRIARLGTGHADQRRHDITADDGPGLGQRRRRQAEQQHRRSGHRGDQEGQRAHGGSTQHAAADEGGEQQHQQRTERGRHLPGQGSGSGRAQAPQPLEQRREHEYAMQQMEPAITPQPGKARIPPRRR